MILLCNREYGTTCSHKKMETGHIISADSMRSSNFDFYSCNDSLLCSNNCNPALSKRQSDQKYE